MPLYPLLGSRFAKTMKKPASMEFVIHIFDPLIRYPSAVFSALVRNANASEPDAGSERQKDPTVCVANLGSHFRFDPAVPYFNIAVLTKVLWTSTSTLTLGSTRASSSIPTIPAVKFIPAPPYSSGISIPINPCSKRSSTIDGSILSASSISRTFGSMVSCANFDTESAIIISTSDMWLIGLGGMAESRTSAFARGTVVERYRKLEKTVNEEITVDMITR